MTKLTYAWCEKEQDLLTPLDLRDIWRQNSAEPLLQCPDEQCRKENPASRIIPVCCNPDDPCEKMQPYFRTGPEHPHRTGCRYTELADAVDYILTHKKEFTEDTQTNLVRDLKGISDTSLLPDGYLTAYDPKTELEEIERETAKRMRDGSSRQKAIRLARASVPHKTSSLKRIVEMCELLDKTGERELVPLSIPGRVKTATYKNAFFPVKRRWINAREKDGVYILPCTKNVFSKSYSTKLFDLMNWTDSDATAYIKEMIECLSNI